VKEPVKVVSISTDQNCVVIVTESGSLIFYQFDDGKQVHEIPLPGQVTSLVWSPDAKYLAVAIDNVVYLFRNPLHSKTEAT